MHHAPFLNYFEEINCPPSHSDIFFIALQAAFPPSNYYEDSVTIPNIQTLMS